MTNKLQGHLNIVITLIWGQVRHIAISGMNHFQEGMSVKFPAVSLRFWLKCLKGRRKIEENRFYITIIFIHLFGTPNKNYI